MPPISVLIKPASGACNMSCAYCFYCDEAKKREKALVSTCVIFTVITVAYMLVLQIINISASSAAIETGRVLLFLLFSCLLAIANAILSIKKIHTALRYIIHYSIFIFAFSICFCLPNKMDSTKIIIGITLASAGYTVIMLLI